ncbi:MAG TPA: carboxypeptidase-like regulatory domain-containing protein [Nitrospirota bacterium]|nr:carboxypeptidase-like regulatory domain-containing protein [Nitrospirota bacterium]
MRFSKIILYIVLFVLSACSEKKEGAVEGTVIPPNARTRITAAQNGRTIMTAGAKVEDGKFRMVLPPGTYDISVTMASAPFPMTFPGIAVEAGKTTVIPRIELSQHSGNAILSGRISPGGTGIRVTILHEGSELASANAAADGSYEFTGLSEGRYTIQVSAADYARDAVEVNIAESARTTQNIRLLYVSTVYGVDWTTGIIRATGTGLPPPTANAIARREMAKRAALADAQRNLLKIIEQIKTGPNENLKAFLGDTKYAQKIHGFLQGYRVTAERELSDGTVEIELELSLTGPDGLSRYITD